MLEIILILTQFWSPKKWNLFPGNKPKITSVLCVTVGLPVKPQFGLWGSKMASPYLEMPPACLAWRRDTIKNLLPGNIIGLKWGCMLCRLIFHDGFWGSGQSAGFIDLTQDILFSSLYAMFYKVKAGWLVLVGEVFTKCLFSCHTFPSPPTPTTFLLPLNWVFSVARASQ